MAYDKNNRRRGGEEAQSEFTEKVVSLNRVSKTVKGGRVAKFSALCVIGDGKGRVGYGLGKANEAAGIKNIRTKCLRTNNPQNVVAATMAGLKALRNAEQVAAVRGKTAAEVKG